MAPQLDQLIARLRRIFEDPDATAAVRALTLRVGTVDATSSATVDVELGHGGVIPDVPIPEHVQADGVSEGDVVYVLQQGPQWLVLGRQAS